MKNNVRQNVVIASIFILLIFIAFRLVRYALIKYDSKNQAIIWTVQRPARLPFQALARLNYPPAKQSSIIFYFHPECDHCSYEAEAIQKQLEDFRSTQLIWISAADSSSIRQFAQQHQLDQAPNVHWMSDTADVFARSFGSSSVPSVWIYGQDGQLLKHYKGETKPAALLKYLHDDKTRH